MPLPVSLPLGIMIWILGLVYNLRLIQRQKKGLARHRYLMTHGSHQRIAARTLMNLGVAVGSRSWLTLIVVAILVPFYAAAARRRERYLDYMRTGMLSDAFPKRIVRH